MSHTNFFKNGWLTIGNSDWSGSIELKQIDYDKSPPEVVQSIIIDGESLYDILGFISRQQIEKGLARIDNIELLRILGFDV